MFKRVMFFVVVLFLFIGCSPYNKRKVLMYDARTGRYMPINSYSGGMVGNNMGYNQAQPTPYSKQFARNSYNTIYQAFPGGANPFAIPMNGAQNPKFQTKSLNTNGKNYNYPIINNYYSKDSYGATTSSPYGVLVKKKGKVIVSQKACTESYDMNKIYKSDFPVTYRVKRIKGCN